MNARNHLKTAAVAAVLTASGLVPAAAQTDDMQGERVRVQRSADVWTEGVVVEWSDARLALRASDGTTERLPWSEVREVTRYRARRHTVQGLAVGGIAGALLGGAVAASALEPCPTESFCVGPRTSGEWFAVGAILGGTAGGAVGAIVGALMKSTSWEPVVVPSVSVSSGPALRLEIRLHAGQ